MRQLAAAAGDGPLGFAGSPGQLETSLNSGYTVGPCNSYLEGPTLVWGDCSRIALDLPSSSSLAEERTPRSLLLTGRGRDTDARSRRCDPPLAATSLPLDHRRLARPRCRNLALSDAKPGLTQVSDGLHRLQPVQVPGIYVNIGS